MGDNLIVFSLEDVATLIRILLANNKTVTQISLTINGNYEIWWDDVNDE